MWLMVVAAAVLTAYQLWVAFEDIREMRRRGRPEPRRRPRG